MKFQAILPSLKKSCFILILSLNILICTIYIRCGVYNPRLHVTHSGDSEAPITFQNYQDEKVILDGSTFKLEDDGLFTIEDKNYIQVKGLEFHNLKSAKVNETPIGIYITRTGSISRLEIIISITLKRM
ncbi:hypothetical protein CN447_27925 [Bacillus thuringiensis]|nr:hypothetical protein CN447_27925 [Bacillus thuringiensis]